MIAWKGNEGECLLTEEEQSELQHLESLEAQLNSGQFKDYLTKAFDEYYAEILLIWMNRFRDVPTPMEYALSEEYASGYLFAQRQMAAILLSEAKKEISRQPLAARHIKRTRETGPEQKSRNLHLDL